MKTFNEFLEAKIIGNNLQKNLRSMTAAVVQDAKGEIAAGAALGSVAGLPGAAVGAAASVPGIAIKAGTKTLGVLAKQWRENQTVKAAKELAKKTITAKAARRDPRAIEEIADSYIDVPDELLELLSQKEQEQIRSNLMASVKSGNLQDWHVKKLAVDILKNKAEKINSALRTHGNMPNIRLRIAFR